MASALLIGQARATARTSAVFYHANALQPQLFEILLLICMHAC